VVRFQSDIVRIVTEALSSARCRFWGVTSGIRARFCRYPRVQSACRITLPTDIVVSSVKTILLKMCWIALSRSAFYSLPMCFSPLTFASFESSLLPSSSFRILRGWTISCLQPNRSALSKFIIFNASKNPLLVVSRRNLLLVVSTTSTWYMKI
jgi:hypothetical protein